MPNSATYKLSITTENSSSHTLNSVVMQPRVSTPIDLQAATSNIKVESDSDCPPMLQTVVRYIFTEFFSLAHRTGLYNRQKLLWESIARINDVAVHRLQQGLFSKTNLPYYDLHFQDSKGRPLLLACVAEPEAVMGADADGERKMKDAVKALQQRAEKLRSKGGTLSGVFLVYPKPFPENVLKIVEDLTGASDPVGKFESILPEPLLIPIDLLEVNLEQLESSAEINMDAMRLVHPDLVVKGRAKS
ncbi:MAG: hypothetical protein JST89_21665 [Cyanobacteria bacterium SZAS-4]|nr:hypothetical protein [Cyanobacteria bacterium SZAS-4]